MTRLLLWLVGCLAAIPALIGVLWLADWAAGGPYAAPVAALIALPLLAVTFRKAPL